MSLIKFNTKEEAGVENVPRRVGSRLFFEIVYRKFFELVKVNWICFLFSIPFFVTILLFVAPAYTKIFAPNFVLNDAVSTIIYNLFFAGLLFNFIGVGPASAAYSYIIRLFVNGSHVWIFYDGFKAFKRNFKQTIILWVVDIVILYIMAIVIGYYKMCNGFVVTFAFFFSIVVLFIYAVAHSIIYQQIVTFENNLNVIVKNAFDIVFSKLLIYFLLGGLGLIICYLMLGCLGVTGLILYISVGILFAKMPLEFYTASIIKSRIK